MESITASTLTVRAASFLCPARPLTLQPHDYSIYDCMYEAVFLACLCKRPQFEVIALLLRLVYTTQRCIYPHLCISARICI